MHLCLVKQPPLLLPHVMLLPLLLPPPLVTLPLLHLLPVKCLWLLIKKTIYIKLKI
jgi:hypothetical protein